MNSEHPLFMPQGSVRALLATYSRRREPRLCDHGRRERCSHSRPDGDGCNSLL